LTPSPPPPFRFPPNAQGFTTQIFWDSDVGKWIEAASYALSHRRDAAIEKQIEDITDLLTKAQLPDGWRATIKVRLSDNQDETAPCMV